MAGLKCNMRGFIGVCLRLLHSGFRWDIHFEAIWTALCLESRQTLLLDRCFMFFKGKLASSLTVIIEFRDGKQNSFNAFLTVLFVKVSHKHCFKPFPTTRRGSATGLVYTN